MPALLYVSAMTYGMMVFLGTEFLGELRPTNLPKFWGFNLPYLVVPLLLGYRMRRPHPFSVPILRGVPVKVLAAVAS